MNANQTKIELALLEITNVKAARRRIYGGHAAIWIVANLVGFNAATHAWESVWSSLVSLLVSGGSGFILWVFARNAVDEGAYLNTPVFKLLKYASLEDFEDMQAIVQAGYLPQGPALDHLKAELLERGAHWRDTVIREEEHRRNGVLWQTA